MVREVPGGDSSRGLRSLIAYEGTLAVKGSHRLYEQKQTAPEGAAALDDYLRRWRRWTTAGLEGLTVCYALPALQPKAHKAKRE